MYISAKDYMKCNRLGTYQLTNLRTNTNECTFIITNGKWIKWPKKDMMVLMITISCCMFSP